VNAPARGWLGHICVEENLGAEADIDFVDQKHHPQSAMRSDVIHRRRLLLHAGSLLAGY
jgi:hypothetical protein